jgi:hypothetical protein
MTVSPAIPPENKGPGLQHNGCGFTTRKRINSRQIILPDFVDTNKVNAEFKDGILRVTLAKREESKPKQIEVKIK